MAHSRIRILYLQPAPLFGGAERQAAEQASFLPHLGIDLTVIGGPGQAIADWMKSAPLARFVHSRNFPAWAPQKGLAALTLPWRYLRCGLAARAEFARIVAEQRSELIIASLPFTWIVGTLVARKAGIPIVWRAGGSRIPRSQAIALWLLSRFLRPDLLLCNGQAVLRLFAPLVGAPAAVLPNGIDHGRFKPKAGDRARYRPPEATMVVGFAGRLAPSKHLEDVIGMARRLQLIHPGVRVLVAGDGSEQERCKRLAREAGVENLSFLGFVADMPSFYAACDIIVLTSDSEGCSNVLLEAMTAERAVVAADIAPVRELVQHGRTGLVYPLGNVEALTAAVCKLVTHEPLRRYLGRTAARSVASFTTRATAERLAWLARSTVAAHAVQDERPLRTAAPPPAQLAWSASSISSSELRRARPQGRRRTG